MRGGRLNDVAGWEYGRAPLRRLLVGGASEIMRVSSIVPVARHTKSDALAPLRQHIGAAAARNPFAAWNRLAVSILHRHCDLLPRPQTAQLDVGSSFERCCQPRSID